VGTLHHYEEFDDIFVVPRGSKSIQYQPFASGSFGWKGGHALSGIILDMTNPAIRIGAGIIEGYRRELFTTGTAFKRVVVMRIVIPNVYGQESIHFG
jgi:hypothetical protein